MNFEKKKPTPKREFAITRIFPLGNNIEFEATGDILQEIRNSNFGEITPAAKNHNLTVSSLFDFNDVLNYLQSFS